MKFDFLLPHLQFCREIYLDSLRTFDGVLPLLDAGDPIPLRCLELAFDVISLETLIEGEGV
jgi:hypothetical protein